MFNAASTPSPAITAPSSEGVPSRAARSAAPGDAMCSKSFHQLLALPNPPPEDAPAEDSRPASPDPLPRAPSDEAAAAEEVPSEISTDGILPPSSPDPDAERASKDKEKSTARAATTQCDVVPCGAPPTISATPLAESHASRVEANEGSSAARSSSGSSNHSANAALVRIHSPSATADPTIAGDWPPSSILNPGRPPTASTDSRQRTDTLDAGNPAKRRIDSTRSRSRESSRGKATIETSVSGDGKGLEPGDTIRPAAAAADDGSFGRIMADPGRSELNSDKSTGAPHIAEPRTGQLTVDDPSRSVQSGASVTDVAKPSAAGSAGVGASGQATSSSNAAAYFTLSGPQRSALLHRVARAFVPVNELGGLVRIRLHPESLGSVHLHLRLEQNQLSARMEVECESTRELLREGLPELQQRLAELGVHVDRYEIEVFEDGGQGFASSGQSSTDPRRGRPPTLRSHRIPPNPTPDQDSTVSSPRLQLAGQRHLNLLG